MAEIDILLKRLNRLWYEGVLQTADKGRQMRLYLLWSRTMDRIQKLERELAQTPAPALTEEKR